MKLAASCLMTDFLLNLLRLMISVYNTLAVCESSCEIHPSPSYLGALNERPEDRVCGRSRLGTTWRLLYCEATAALHLLLCYFACCKQNCEYTLKN